MPRHFRLHPALINFAAEFRAVSVRLLAYACGLGALALIAADQFTSIATTLDQAPLHLRSHDAWTGAVRPQPAFSAPVADFSGQSESYDILRHPDGGRKDILRWSSSQTDALLTQIEIYRPSAEQPTFGSAAFEIALRANHGQANGIQAAGVLETKFGPVPLVSFSSHAAGKSQPCVGFAQSFETPRLLVAGWSCQGDSAQTQRQAIACTLDRLTLLSAGNDPKLAELFARAELKRAGCSAPNAQSSDWVTATHNPVLRGRI
jgi:hypothetical protein